MRHDSTTPQPALDERKPIAEIMEQWDFLTRHLDSRVIDTLPSIVLLLNAQRQIVYANQALIDLLGAQGPTDILGLRHGELFQCVHSDKNPGGCGTSDACVHCGALQAILGSFTGQTVDRESRVLVRHREGVRAMNLQVRAVPLDLDGHHFIIIYLQDIAQQKIHELMDNIFLHDALNTLNGLTGAAGLLHDETQGDLRELSGIILERSQHLEREIRAQRILRAAENDSLEIQPEEVNPATVCNHLASLFQLGGYENPVVCNHDPETPRLVTDPRLLYRILENLIKNALEASPKDAPVHVECAPAKDAILFTVTNKGWMPVDVQSQLFQRAFSTKGKGRGLGTYSVKLLTENYLGGTVAFVSGKDTGTSFTVTIPLNPPATAIDAS